MINCYLFINRYYSPACVLPSSVGRVTRISISPQSSFPLYHRQLIDDWESTMMDVLTFDSYPWFQWRVCCQASVLQIGKFVNSLSEEWNFTDFSYLRKYFCRFCTRHTRVYICKVSWTNSEIRYEIIELSYRRRIWYRSVGLYENNACSALVETLLLEPE